MKMEVQRALRQCPLSDAVLVQIREDCLCDLARVEEILRDRYAGREAPWPTKEAESIREFVLQETELFPWQLRELETRLTTSGLRVPGRAKRYSFPDGVLRAS